MKLKELQKKITPFPWYATRFHVQSAALNEDNYVAQADGDNPQQERNNAAYIAHCCNHFAEVVEALVRITEKVERANSIQHSGGSIIAEDWNELYDLANDSRAALAKAEEVKGTV